MKAINIYSPSFLLSESLKNKIYKVLTIKLYCWACNIYGCNQYNNSKKEERIDLYE